MEEIVANIFARYLLLPPELTRKEYSRYVPNPEKKEEEEKSDSVKVMNDWYKYISILAELPYEQAVLGIEQIKYLNLLKK